MEAEDLEVLPSVAIRRNNVKKSHCFIVQILSHCTGLQAQFSKIHLLVASNHKMLSMKNLLALETMLLLIPILLLCQMSSLIHSLSLDSVGMIFFHTVQLNLCGSLTSAFLSGLPRASFNSLLLATMQNSGGK